MGTCRPFQNGRLLIFHFLKFFTSVCWVQLISGQTSSKFGHFAGVQKSSKFILVDEPGFKRVRSLTCQVRSSSKFDIFGFNPTLVGMTLSTSSSNVQN